MLLTYLTRNYYKLALEFSLYMDTRQARSRINQQAILLDNTLQPKSLDLTFELSFGAQFIMIKNRLFGKLHMLRYMIQHILIRLH